MHFAFIPYGKRTEVELLLRDMEAQKHLLRMKKGKKKKDIYIQGQIRLMPLGVVEYIFPKEDKDIVLNTLVTEKERYELPKIIKAFMKKFLKLEKIPEFKREKRFLWIKDFVNIISLGIREDGEIVGHDEQDKGWTHEAI